MDRLVAEGLIKRVGTKQGFYRLFDTELELVNLREARDDICSARAIWDIAVNMTKTSLNETQVIAFDLPYRPTDIDYRR